MKGEVVLELEKTLCTDPACGSAYSHFIANSALVNSTGAATAGQRNSFLILIVTSVFV
jgi:hypothetical protein